MLEILKSAIVKSVLVISEAWEIGKHNAKITIDRAEKDSL